jgi:hypothetical protein
VDASPNGPGTSLTITGAAQRRTAPGKAAYRRVRIAMADIIGERLSISVSLPTLEGGAPIPIAETCAKSACWGKKGGSNRRTLRQ